jgi:anthranilate synthase/aminodeoxychorismate synthase-like glutamine amidotransferase
MAIFKHCHDKRKATTLRLRSPTPVFAFSFDTSRKVMIEVSIASTLPVMILVIDNYDSFTYNLVQLLGSILRGQREHLAVKRNNEISLDEIATAKPDRILLSPGPGRPEDAGVTVDVIRRFAATIPILGVCLGHQAIGVAFGGHIVRAPTLMHGRTSVIRHFHTSIFTNIKNPFTATRYHSLVLARENFPPSLAITATTDDGVIMGVQHKSLPVAGVQFHPESILSEEGEKMLRNWLDVK